MMEMVTGLPVSHEELSIISYSVFLYVITWKFFFFFVCELEVEKEPILKWARLAR